MAKRPLKKRIKYSFIHRLILALIYVVNIFPRRWVMAVTGFLGGIAYHLFNDARNITIRNLNMVYADSKSPAEIHDLSKEVFKMLGRNAGDIIRGVSINTVDGLKKFIRIEGEEHLQKALNKGNGVVIVTSHIGAFEFVGYYLGLANYRPMVVMTALKDERLNKLLVDHRVSTGLEAIERGKATIKLMKGLKSGRIVLILIDQDTRVKSRFIKFLGIPAATPIGGTLMAQRTGASVLPMHITLQPDRSQLINIGPEVEIQHTDDEEQDLLVNTQRISDTTEQAILRNPEQWVWMHERWKTQPGEEIK
jgi:KDO2-lipid IV(A) lauroyltransferase